MKKMEPDFLIIPYLVIKNEKLQAADLMVYGTVYWFQKMKDGKCTAGNPTISKIAGVSERTVRESLEKLEAEDYIERIYKDERRKVRLEIKCKIAFGKVGAPAPTVGATAPTSVGATAPQSNKSSKEVRVNDILAAPSAADSEKDINKRIAEIINAFKPVKPFIQKLYGQPPQRQAAKEMVDEFGFEKALKIAEYAVSVQGQPFAPVITTPYQLREKVGNLRIWAMGEKNKRQKLWSTL